MLVWRCFMEALYRSRLLLLSANFQSVLELEPQHPSEMLTEGLKHTTPFAGALLPPFP